MRFQHMVLESVVVGGRGIGSLETAQERQGAFNHKCACTPIALPRWRLSKARLFPLLPSETLGALSLSLSAVGYHRRIKKKKKFKASRDTESFLLETWTRSQFCLRVLSTTRNSAFLVFAFPGY